MSERTGSRVAPTVASLIGAVVGLLLTVPVGSTTVECAPDAGARCHGLVHSVLVNVIADRYPSWIVVAGLAAGAFVGFVIWLFASGMWSGRRAFGSGHG